MQAQQQAPTPDQQPGLGVSPENPIQGATPQGPQGQPSLQDLLEQLHSGGGAPMGGAQMAPAVAQAPAPAPAGV